MADAQSLAVGKDNPYIEPQHLLLALIGAGGRRAQLRSLAKAGVNVHSLARSLAAGIERLPKVEGHGGEVNVSRELNNLFNITDKEAQKRGDQFIPSELFLLALTEDKGETGRLLKQHGGEPQGTRARDRRPCAAARRSTTPRPKASAKHFPNTRWT